MHRQERLLLRVGGDSEGWWGPPASTALSKTFPAKAGVVLAAPARDGASSSSDSNSDRAAIN